MNFHALLDMYIITVSALLAGGNRFLCKSIDGPAFADCLPGIDLQLPEIKEAGKYAVTAVTPAGNLDAAFWVAQWKGSDYPTLIYHHGSNERPFETSRFAKNSFKNVFLADKQFQDVNLIVIRAPFHDKSTGDYMRAMGHLNNFTAMLSVSVKLTEALIAHYRPLTNNIITVSGISLGGWVCNLHRSYYNSADAYIPIMAGAALDEIFLSSVYRKLTGKPARNNPEVLNKALNFEEDFQKVAEDNIFPLLAGYDQIIRYDRQRECYGKQTVNVLEKGHMTGALASDDLRRHIKSVLENVQENSEDRGGK